MTNDEGNAVIQVKDSSRVLQFDGKMIAHSTSWRRGQYRWVEFTLYRTTSGVYVIARVGMSMLYHHPDCKVVSRNNLKESPAQALEQNAYPCTECHPEFNRSVNICMEKPRHWAQVCDSPEAVLEALYKYDEAGNRYLTLVAQRLMEEASEEDVLINNIYGVETIL
jgi:hypothetical protein